MVARHDLKKKHHGRRKKGSRKRHQAWLRRHKMRVKSILNRKQRRRLGIRRRLYRLKRRL